MKKVLTTQESVELVLKLATSICNPSALFFKKKLVKAIKDNIDNLDANSFINLHIISTSILAASMLEQLLKSSDVSKERMLESFYGQLKTIFELMPENRVERDESMAVDGNFLDLDDFGIDADKFQKISSKIGETIKEIIREKP